MNNILFDYILPGIVVLLIMYLVAETIRLVLQ